MRTHLMLLPLVLCASPALAQAPAPAAPQATAPAQVPPEVQRALNDPAMADRLANAMQVLSRAFLDLPVGEIQAAMEGRKPTAAERKLTVRQVGRRDNRNFDRDFQQQIANAKPTIEAGMKALSQALPAMLQGMQQAAEAIERASTNLPSPTYPKQ
jgi:hypothetical protein